MVTKFGGPSESLREGEKGVFFLEAQSNNSGVIDEAIRFEYTSDDIGQFREQNSWRRRFDSADLVRSEDSG